jgi:hypothetical protein
MKSAGAPGTSGSGMGNKVPGGQATGEWQVNMYTLPSLLRRWNVSGSDAFIKVETESFECKLLGSWIEWLEALPGAEPTFFVALYSQVEPCSNEEYDAIAGFARLFRSVVSYGKYLIAADLEGSAFRQYYALGEIPFSDKPNTNF